MGGVPQFDTFHDHPIFLKNLTKTDVDVRLSFPMEALNEFQFPEGKDKVEFDVTDGMDNSWKFGLSKRNEARNSHPKPVLSSGWRSYVKAKGLKMNDRLILYGQTEKLATRFKVRAERKVPKAIKLLGKVIEAEVWADVEEVEPSILRASQMFGYK